MVVEETKVQGEKELMWHFWLRVHDRFVWVHGCGGIEVSDVVTVYESIVVGQTWEFWRYAVYIKIIPK